MSKSSPLLGVVTALGRPEYDYLRDAARSVAALAPLSANGRYGVQWVIAYDGFDATPEDIAREVAPSGVTPLVVRAGSHGWGPGPARNTALEQITAPWVLTLDADDMLDPTGVKTLLTATARWDVPWAAGRTRVLSLGYDREMAGVPAADPFDPGVLEKGAFYNYRLRTGQWPFHACATIVSADLLRLCGGWPENDDMATKAEDTSLWSVLSAHAYGAWVDATVLNYRKHVGSLTDGDGWGKRDDQLAATWRFIAAGTTNP